MKLTSAPLPWPTNATVDRTTLDARLCALGGAIKPKALTEAKGRLPEQFATPVDFTVRIRGTVSKGIGEPGCSGTTPATCDLFNRSQISEVLRRLKVKPEQLLKALRETAREGGHSADYSSHPANAALLTVINQVGAEIAATLKPNTWSSNGKAATVRTDVEFEIVS